VPPSGLDASVACGSQLRGQDDGLLWMFPPSQKVLPKRAASVEDEPVAPPATPV
jgi:hypothetical protein